VERAWSAIWDAHRRETRQGLAAGVMHDIVQRIPCADLGDSTTHQAATD
jgi:hypothetical protein